MKKFTILLYLSIISTALLSQSKEYKIVNNFGEDGHTQWAKIEKDSMYGFINRGGNITVPIEYDSFSKFGEDGYNGWIKSKKRGKFGFIDIDGTVVIPCEFDSLSIFEIEYNIKWIKAKKDGLYGFLNLSGDTIIPFEFRNSYQINSKYPNLINKSVVQSGKGLTKLLQENNIEDIKRAIRDIGAELKRPLSKKEQRELSKDIDRIIKNISDELSSREIIGDSTDR